MIKGLKEFRYNSKYPAIALCINAAKAEWGLARHHLVGLACSNRSSTQDEQQLPMEGIEVAEIIDAVASATRGYRPRRHAQTPTLEPHNKGRP